MCVCSHNWGLKCCFINKSICVANILIFFNIYPLNKLFSQSNTFIFKGLWQKWCFTESHNWFIC